MTVVTLMPSSQILLGTISITELGRPYGSKPRLSAKTFVTSGLLTTKGYQIPLTDMSRHVPEQGPRPRLPRAAGDRVASHRARRLRFPWQRRVADGSPQREDRPVLHAVHRIAHDCRDVPAGHRSHHRGKRLRDDIGTGLRRGRHGARSCRRAPEAGTRHRHANARQRRRHQPAVLSHDLSCRPRCAASPHRSSLATRSATPALRAHGRRRHSRSTRNTASCSPSAKHRPSKHPPGNPVPRLRLRSRMSRCSSISSADPFPSVPCLRYPPVPCLASRVAHPLSDTVAARA